MKYLLLFFYICIIYAYKLKTVRIKQNKHIQNDEYNYEIPDWVYKKVFRHNKPTKLKDTDYYHHMKNKIDYNNTNK
jgi:hypothetical protein